MNREAACWWSESSQVRTIHSETLGRLDFLSMQRKTEEVIWTTVHRPGLELVKFTFKTDQRFSLREKKIQSS